MKLSWYLTLMLVAMDAATVPTQCTDIKSLNEGDLDLLLGTYCWHHDYTQDQLGEEIYSWGTGLFVVNATTTIDRYKKTNLLYFMEDGSGQWPILQIIKISENHFILKIPRQERMSSDFPAILEIGIIITEKGDYFIDYSQCKITEFVRNGEITYVDDIYKLSGPAYSKSGSSE